MPPMSPFEMKMQKFDGKWFWGRWSRLVLAVCSVSIFGVPRRSTLAVLTRANGYGLGVLEASSKGGL